MREKERSVYFALGLLRREVRDLQVKIDALLEIHKGPKINLDERRLLDLPPRLQRTMLAVIDLGKPCSATMISEKTGKARAMESQCLNELAWQGMLLKSRKGKRVYFEPAGSLK